MKIKFAALAICAALKLASPANACSYPVREHAVFAPGPTEPGLQGRVTVRLVIDELLIPERLAKNGVTGWYRRWSAVRGEVLSNTDQLNAGQKVELTGPFDGACFYPDQRYERDQQERLIVWVTGTIVHRDGAILIEPSYVQLSPSVLEKGQMVWAKIRWGLSE